MIIPSRSTQAALGVRYNGLQETPDGPLAMYTDLRTESSFMIRQNETLTGALLRSRRQFAGVREGLKQVKSWPGEDHADR